MLLRILGLFIAMFLMTAAGSAQARDLKHYAHTTALFSNCTFKERQYIRSVLVAGLQNLDKINHDLLENRIENYGSRKARFNCEADPRTKKFVAYTNRYIRDNKDNGLLPIANINVGQLVHNKSPTYPREILIFHEFLHFLLFDNLTMAMHNAEAVMNGADFAQEAGAHPHFVDARGQILDTVYSCSAAAFASKSVDYEAFYVARWDINESIKSCRASIPFADIVDMDVAPLDYFGGDHTIHSSAACLLGSRTPWAPGDRRPHVPAWTKELREKCAI